jgi:hypothetical protein
MSFFIEAIKERIWPTFVNEKNPMKWVFFNGSQASKENPRHKNFTILKKHYEPRQSNNKK